jgi:iduronate 2-sulfatase
VTFSNAYCQQAVCNPSRASVMTGLRPDQIGVTNLESHFRQRLPDIETLPQAFMRNGYQSVGIGKIFHGQKNTQDDVSWSKPPVMNLSQKKNEYVLERNREGGKADSYEWSEADDEAYEDGRIAKEAIRELQELKKSENPFFLALGFKKPHLPFCAPKKYWDLYDEKMFTELPHPEKPTDAPAIAFHDCQELRGYRDIGKREIAPAKASRLWQGYYACISYVDAQIGKIVNTLDELGLAENTIVVLWGDHGYHLGEQGLWCKSTNFELDARTPLIISAPGISKAGVHSASIVEALDIYPTLVDLCGLKISGKPAGVSLRPVLTDPGAEVKQAAFSQFVRPYSALRNQPPTHMGYSVRTKEWRCTAWFNLQNDSIEFSELYRLNRGRIETENLAGARRYGKIEKELTDLLNEYKTNKD